METTVSADPAVLVLVDGDSDGAIRNAKGHLFEEFAGRLLELHGYEQPTRERLNVTSDGIELDLVVRHKLSKHRAIVECKCYSTPVKAQAATSFFGKLAKERLSAPDTHGYLIVTPRLSPEADEFIREVQRANAGVTLLGAGDIVDILTEYKIIERIAKQQSLITDETVVITAHGTYVAAKESDPVTRTAVRVIVKSRDGLVPRPVIELIASSAYSEELAVIDAMEPSDSTASRPEEPVIALVRGSRSDFEYQFPASPQFFVGRKPSLQAVTEALLDAPGVVVLNSQSGWGKTLWLSEWPVKSLIFTVMP